MIKLRKIFLNILSVLGIIFVFKYFIEFIIYEKNASTYYNACQKVEKDMTLEEVAKLYKLNVSELLSTSKVQMKDGGIFVSLPSKFFASGNPTIVFECDSYTVKGVSCFSL